MCVGGGGGGGGGGVGGGMLIHFQGEESMSKNNLLPFEKDATLKEKILLLCGGNSPFRKDIFLEGTWRAEKQTGSHKVVSLLFFFFFFFFFFFLKIYNPINCIRSP